MCWINAQSLKTSEEPLKETARCSIIFLGICATPLLSALFSILLPLTTRKKTTQHTSDARNGCCWLGTFIALLFLIMYRIFFTRTFVERRDLWGATDKFRGAWNVGLGPFVLHLLAEYSVDVNLFIIIFKAIFIATVNGHLKGGLLKLSYRSLYFFHHIVLGYFVYNWRWIV